MARHCWAPLINREVTSAPDRVMTPALPASTSKPSPPTRSEAVLGVASPPSCLRADRNPMGVFQQLQAGGGFFYFGIVTGAEPDKTGADQADFRVFRLLHIINGYISFRSENGS